MPFTPTDLHKRHLLELEEGPAYLFKNKIHANIPRVCIGVYGIWREDALIYIGQAGRAAGRRSGDQFCVYVCDRLVIRICRNPISSASHAANCCWTISFYVFVHDHLSYRYTVAPDPATARAIEDAARCGALRAGKPLLNPVSAHRRPTKNERAGEIRSTARFDPSPMGPHGFVAGLKGDTEDSSRV
jgi:hypothetical protein